MVNSSIQEIFEDALTVFFYIASRDYDISGADFTTVVREHVAKGIGTKQIFSDAERRQWSVELAAEFIRAVRPLQSVEQSTCDNIEAEAFAAGFAVAREAAYYPYGSDYCDWVDAGRPTYDHGMGWMHRVTSRSLLAVGFDLGFLMVKFVNGSGYEYKTVPRDLYEQLLAAESKGAFFTATIKKDPARFPFRKLEPE